MNSRTEFDKYNKLLGNSPANKEDRLKEYLDGYTSENRLTFIECAFNKYYGHHYSILKQERIKVTDYIVTDQNIRNNMKGIIDKKECSVETFTEIFNLLDIDQIDYIGY
jgi:hypothetical protein